MYGSSLLILKSLKLGDRNEKHSTTNSVGHQGPLETPRGPLKWLVLKSRTYWYGGCRIVMQVP